jgi:type IV secretion system protein VirB11
MSVIPIRSEALSRGARMLRTALGCEIARWLEEPAVIEVMLNPDGRLWVDRLGEGLAATDCLMSAADGERIIRLVAHHVGAEVHTGAPRVSAELPDGGERFEGLLPPVVAAPSFAIRKPAVAVFTLADYVSAGIMDAWQAEALGAAVAERKNILVAGGTSTGKTTLTNALLAEISSSPDRVVLIEDTRELQCAAPNLVSLRTKDGVATLSDLVRSALRLAYATGSAGKSGGAAVAGGMAGVGRAAGGAALSPLRKAADSAKGNFREGARAAASNMGGRVASSSGSPSSAQSESGPPSWAKSMKQRQSLGHSASLAAHTVRAGDGHGAGASIDTQEKD